MADSNVVGHRWLVTGERWRVTLDMCYITNYCSLFYLIAKNIGVIRLNSALSASLGPLLAHAEGFPKSLKKLKKNMLKMSKIWKSEKHSKIFLKIQKISFKKNANFLNIFFAQKNAIFLVLSIKEISLWPELSKPPLFRIQGVPWALRMMDEVQTEDRNPCA